MVSTSRKEFFHFSLKKIFYNKKKDSAVLHENNKNEKRIFKDPGCQAVHPNQNLFVFENLHSVSHQN